MEGNLMGMVGAFIAVAILLGVGTIILGNSVMDCSGLPGYNSTDPALYSTGWAGTCNDANEQSQSAYVLLLIVLIVIAAVVILTVVRML
jgi:hypothetical protein